MHNLSNLDLIKKSVRIFNKYTELESKPTKYASGIILYPSEIHTIEVIGKNFNLNITEIANKLGVTKGTISKTLRKLQSKGFIEKNGKPDNNKEILIKLTEEGEKAFNAHEEYHQNFYNEIDRYLKRLTVEEKTTILDFLNKSEGLLDEFINKKAE